MQEFHENFCPWCGEIVAENPPSKYHPRGDYSCTDCGAYFGCKPGLTAHRDEYHHPLICSFCKKDFFGERNGTCVCDACLSPSPALLLGWIRCLHCLKQFGTIREMRKHMEKSHRVGCPSCKLVFVGECVLERHIRGGETCDECNQYFGCQRALLAHRAKFHRHLICPFCKQRRFGRKGGNHQCFF